MSRNRNTSTRRFYLAASLGLAVGAGLLVGIVMDAPLAGLVVAIGASVFILLGLYLVDRQQRPAPARQEPDTIGRGVAYGLLLGVPLGIAFGLALGNMAFMAIGIGGGLSIGLSIGIAQEEQHKKG